MKRFLFLVLIITILPIKAQKTIHVFVALCDNANQGIVRVPESLGNGQDPKSNLYWGAIYGLKSYFKYKAQDWILVESPASEKVEILDRVLFKHRTKELYLLAEAYDGREIKRCINDFLLAANGQGQQELIHENKSLHFGGAADLVAYCGHNGLMEFDLDPSFKPITKDTKEAIILACYSKDYFAKHIKKAQAQPLLWTSHLMAPEAYTLKAAIDGWLMGESDEAIAERAAQAYHKYQKCGLRGARGLLKTGY